MPILLLTRHAHASSSHGAVPFRGGTFFDSGEWALQNDKPAVGELPVAWKVLGPIVAGPAALGNRQDTSAQGHKSSTHSGCQYPSNRQVRCFAAPGGQPLLHQRMPSRLGLEASP